MICFTLECVSREQLESNININKPDSLSQDMKQTEK